MTELAEQAPDVMVRAAGVHKWYGDLHVLKGIDLTVRRGEVLCLIGASGSGKSTFIRTVNGLEPIQRGEISVAGRPVGAGGVRVGMVFQNFNLFWHMTLLENLTLAPVHVLRLPRAEAEERARALLARVGLADKAASYPRKLSGGQQQRAAIARALAMRPAVMLFDEPTSALDPETTGEVLDVMEELAADGMTMIVVSHEMGFVRRAAHRVVMMEDGVISEEADPTAVGSHRGRIGEFTRRLS